MITGDEGRVYTGDHFTKSVWQVALRKAGLAYRKRADGTHALRHFYTSTLLARGCSVKELAVTSGVVEPRAGTASRRRRVRST
jgi:hypothetical protein